MPSCCGPASRRSSTVALGCCRASEQKVLLLAASSFGGLPPELETLLSPMVHFSRVPCFRFLPPIQTGSL